MWQNVKNVEPKNVSLICSTFCLLPIAMRGVQLELKRERKRTLFNFNLSVWSRLSIY